MKPIGQREWKITVQRKSVTYNSLNEPIETWADYATNLWVGRETLSATEKLAYQEVTAEQKLKFVVLYSSLTSGIRPTDQIIFEGRRFSILAVEESVRRRELTITAAARAE